MKTCILTIIKNEHQYLDEWIKYHLNLGIDHIFIFEDIDSDSHKNITDKYGDKITLRDIRTILNVDEIEQVKQLKINKKTNPQFIYIKKGILYIQNTESYDWCFVIDNDEFITLENESDSLKDIINLYKNYDAFILQWKCYGANGHINKPDYKNNGVIGTYKYEIKGYVPTKSLASYTKTCYNLKKYRQSFFWYTHQPSNSCNFCRTNFSKNRTTPCYDKIYIRHYITKSWEEYVWKKKTRGFLFGQIRDFDFFFEVNPDMKHLKNELINSLEKETLVVLPYKQNGSQGDEINIALKAWKKFCQFNYHFVVIGEFEDSLKDEFPWVEFIFSKTLPKKEGQYNQHLDVQHCFEIVSKKYDKTYDGFIWMVDDNYAIKPFTIEDITTIHYLKESFTGFEPVPASHWGHDKWKTRNLLDNNKLPCLNYTTHYPCYFEFKKLQEIWDRFNMRNESYVLEDVYFNYFKHTTPIQVDSIRIGIWNKFMFNTRFEDAVKNPNIKFVCNSVGGWSKELENELKKLIEN